MGEYAPNSSGKRCSKCMHGMNQTEGEYSRHGKRSQRASLSQIGPVVLDVPITRYLLSSAHAHNRSRDLKGQSQLSISLELR